MRSSLQTITTVFSVVAGLACFGVERASAQSSEPAPGSPPPGIIVTPGTSPLPLLPRPEEQDDARGAPPGLDGGPRRQPNAGCQYNERPLELIV